MNEQVKFRYSVASISRVVFAAMLFVIGTIIVSPNVKAQKMQAVGDSGGHQTPDHCLGPTYLVGFVVRSGTWLDQIAIICSPVDANGRTGVPWGGPLRGGNGGSPFPNVACAPNAVAVGLLIHLTSDGKQVGGIGLDCKDAHDIQRQGLGRIVDLGHNDTKAISQLCNPGNAIVEVTINYGAYVNGIGVTCGPGPKIVSAPPSPPPVVATGSGAGCSGLSGEALSICNEHNAKRAKHGVAPLNWANDLASAATSWVSQCKKDSKGNFCHQKDCGGGDKYGENLSAGWKASNGQPVFPGRTGVEAVDDWYCEGDQGYPNSYNYNNPSLGQSGTTTGCGPKNVVYGHFTQVVWASTQRLGCAKSDACQIPVYDNNGNITGTQPGTYWVCKYDPPGNDPATIGKNVPRPTQ